MVIEARRMETQNSALAFGVPALIMTAVGFNRTHQPVPHNLIDHGYSIMGVEGSVLPIVFGALVGLSTAAYFHGEEDKPKGRRVGYAISGALIGVGLGVASGFIR